MTARLKQTNLGMSIILCCIYVGEDALRRPLTITNAAEVEAATPRRQDFSGNCATNELRSDWMQLYFTDEPILSL
jgi:hypothetical protein